MARIPHPPKRQIVGNNVSAKQSISAAPLLPLAKEKIVTSSTGVRQKVDDCDDCFDESIHLTRFLYLWDNRPHLVVERNTRKEKSVVGRKLSTSIHCGASDHRNGQKRSACPEKMLSFDSDGKHLKGKKVRSLYKHCQRRNRPTGIESLNFIEFFQPINELQNIGQT